jgi:hypothetical protein
MTEEQIIAYVDGELGPIDALRFERAMETDKVLADQVARHRALRERVASHFAPVAQEPLPERLTAMLDRGPTVVSFPVVRPSARPPLWRRYGAIAATLAAGLIAGQLLPRAGQDAPHGAIVAQAGLANALDTKLASAGAGEGYAIGVSFRSKAGDYCRTFEGAGSSGIGCHHDGAWEIRQLSAGDSHAATGYRQAGSADPATLQAAQDMMAGDPLDAAQEKTARDKGWK